MLYSVLPLLPIESDSATLKRVPGIAPSLRRREINCKDDLILQSLRFLLLLIGDHIPIVNRRV